MPPDATHFKLDQIANFLDAETCSEIIAELSRAWWKWCQKSNGPTKAYLIP